LSLYFPKFAVSCLGENNTMKNFTETAKRAAVSLILSVTLLVAIFASLITQAHRVQAAEEIELVERIHLPLTLNRHLSVDIRVVGTTDTEGGLTRGFLPGEELYFNLTGINPTIFTESAQVEWIQTGPCLPEPTPIYSGAVEMLPGNWSFWQVGTAPDCLGVYTHTLEFSFQGITTTYTTNYAVMHPSTNLVDSIQAFDKCNAPSIRQLQAWWDQSPYRAVNLYIGGISRYCDNLHLDAVWVYVASEMGWTFIPTWVGPQAPCTSYKYRMSSNAATAYQEGRSEARAAATTARRLGLLEERVIYYDVESYRYKITGCTEATVRKAVSEFMRGWTEQLHEFGLQSGGYGSPSGSFMTDWASLGSPPDHAWFTHWYTNTYDPDATVWYTTTNSTFLPDTLWPDRQRIKQYAGDHYESWGGIVMGIDSNVVDGGLTGVYARLPVTTDTVTSTATSQSFFDVERTSPAILSAGPVSAESGWAAASSGLYWTDNAGRDWQELTPHGSLGRPLAAYFWNGDKGLYLAVGSNLEAWRTDQSGAAWQAVSLPITAEINPEEISSAEIGAASDSYAWIALRLKTGSNWSQGVLYITSDAGLTWQERPLPAGGHVLFTDSRTGWLIGGRGGDEVYQTSDGGFTWQLMEKPLSDEGFSPIHQFAALQNPTSSWAASLPENIVQITWANPSTGWVTTQTGVCSGYKPRVGEALPSGVDAFRCIQDTRLWQTLDGGFTWSEVTVPGLDPSR
jgi:hypothetical protein